MLRKTKDMVSSVAQFLWKERGSFEFLVLLFTFFPHCNDDIIRICCFNCFSKMKVIHPYDLTRNKNPKCYIYISIYLPSISCFLPVATSETSRLTLFPLVYLWITSKMLILDFQGALFTVYWCFLGNDFLSHKSTAPSFSRHHRLFSTLQVPSLAIT